MNPAFKVLHESGGEYKQSVFNVARYEFSCEGQSELILQIYGTDFARYLDFPSFLIVHQLQ